jgi:DMSO/TMAO reductase YedYZ heme-binding membrane subunit
MVSTAYTCVVLGQQAIEAGVNSMNTASMSTPRWKEYSIAVWIILTVITGLILWLGWPAIRAVIAIIQFYWVIFTTGPHSSEWF